MNKKEILASVIMLLIFGMCLVAIPTQPATETEEIGTSKFIISGWDFADDYGQGIDYVKIYENSTVFWLPIDSIYHQYDYYDNNVFEWNQSVGVLLGVHSYLNKSLTGASSVEEGKNLIRHYIAVALTNGTVIWSQQNITYFSGVPFGWAYSYVYEVILGAEFLAGNVYTVTITYEVFY